MRFNAFPGIPFPAELKKLGFADASCGNDACALAVDNQGLAVWCDTAENTEYTTFIPFQLCSISDYTTQNISHCETIQELITTIAKVREQ
jgi:hypothetical protein